MQMTKRDIADIALVGIIFWLLFQFLMGLLSLVANLGLFEHSRVPHNTGNTGVVIAVEAVYVLVLLILTGLLLFRRSAVLSFLFPDAQEKELSIPSGVESLASCGFWIRLFGIFLFVLRDQILRQPHRGRDDGLAIQRRRAILGDDQRTYAALGHFGGRRRLEGGLDCGEAAKDRARQGTRE